MKFVSTRLSGAFLLVPEPAQDERGFFERTYCEREFAEHGIDCRFVQHSRSVSRSRGTVRGMHFQREPHGEAKVVSCGRGAIVDVIVDLRPTSPTFRQWQPFELNAENRHQLYVPLGFAHGFQTLRDDTEVDYLISEFYCREASSGVRYDDPMLKIQWPLLISVISDRDRNWPLMETAVLESPVP
jgi:dTDP-4-dehydrorhamnose 3,5-epimerase